MCYPRDCNRDQIVSKFPEIMDGMEEDHVDDPVAEMSDNLIGPMLLFRTFICDVIVWLVGMKPSRDDMSISRVLVKMLFDFRHVISNRMIEVKLKSIYGKVVINERRYESIINHYIKVFEGIQDTMDNYINEFENCVGDMERMTALLNRFHHYSESVVSNDYQNLHKNVLNVNKLHQKTQMSLYERFVQNLWNINYK